MGDIGCNIESPWLSDRQDLVPCLRIILFDCLLPLALLKWSIFTILVKAFKQWRCSSSAQYSPLLKNATIANYGAATTRDQDQQAPLQEQDAADEESSSSLNSLLMHDSDGKTAKYIFPSVRTMAALFQVGTCAWALHRLALGTYILDSLVEASPALAKTAYGSHLLVWVYILFLAVYSRNFSSSQDENSFKYQLADIACRHVNIFFTITFFTSVITLRSYYVVHDLVLGSLGYRLAILSTAGLFFFLVIIIHEARYQPEIIMTSSGRIPSGETWASLYSKFMFDWVDGMMKQGSKRTLQDKDLVELPPDNQARNVLRSYRGKGALTMAWGLFLTFRKVLLVQAVYCMTWSVAMFGPPIALNQIIKFIEDPTQYASASHAYLFVIGLFLTSSIQSLSYQQALYLGRVLGIRVQAIAIGEVYAKALRRKDETGAAEADPALADITDKDGKPATKGDVNNLLSVDAQKVSDLMAYVFYLYAYPFQIVVCICALYKLLGTASLYGVLIMCVSQPLTYYISRRFQRKHREVMSCTDKRIKIMNELLGAIRVVKFFAWEREFRKRAFDARQHELKAVRSRLYTYMAISNTWFFIPVLMMVVVFYMYALDNELTASTAFTALALFNTFKSALDELPMITSWLLQANVSLKRIDKFLASDEVSPEFHVEDPRVRIGFINDATFSYDRPSADAVPALKNLNLSFPLNKLSIVCGPTGSGKTTLISSLLGETYCLQGSSVLPHKDPSMQVVQGGAVSGVAYVAQTAWLQNCSIRDNILFGLPYDEERYAKVLYMTALTRDLDILEFGDATEVGERGITLSGGQKQRIAIARAVYSQAQILILDDCLSAVDAHTAKHLYDHCLAGELVRDRTVILVTHHVSLCIKGADYVVVLREGEVAIADEPSAVIASGLLGDEFVPEDETVMDAEEQTAIEGPIPIVPASTKAADFNNESAKLTKEEARAEGSVSWSVYASYIKASGGYIYWILVLTCFCLAQGTIMGQDYWIRVWSSAYGSKETHAAFNVLSQVPSLPYIADSLRLRTTTKSNIDVTYYLGIYFGIGVLALFMVTLRTLTLYNGSLRASSKIHSQLLDRILRAKVRFFDTTPVGRIINRFSSDMETIDQALAPQLAALVYSSIATICVVVLITAITPIFLIPGVIVAFVFWKIGVYYLKTSRDMKRLNSVSRSPIYVQFGESVNGVKTIRAFGAQNRFIDNNYERIDTANRPFIWMWATNRWLHCRVDVLGAFVGFCTGTVLLISRSWVDPGLAGLALSYSLTFTRHILWVIRCYAMNEINCNSVERVHEYLCIEQEPPMHIPETCPPASWPENGAVKVEDLVMQYAPENPAVLRNINFETRPREKIGIVGRTGSGKSTLALSLFRFMEATQGKIYIDGVDISQLGLEDLRSRLTIIPQDPVLFSGTLRSNLDPFHQHDDAELYAALRRAHLQANSGETLTLDAPVTENGSNWSQGQRQLIALARALVKKSALIILDEATSSVDFDTDHQIQKTIRSEFVGSSLLCIAHRIRTVVDYDRILVLDHGKVVEFDTPYELITRPGSVFQQMCERSGEYSELLSLATAKHEAVQQNSPS